MNNNNNNNNNIKLHKVQQVSSFSFKLQGQIVIVYGRKKPA